MADTKTSQTEGPFEGSRCVAGPGNHWGNATIRRVNEDGTFNVELDKKEMILMRQWYGVTLPEISFQDAGLWPAVFSAITADCAMNQASFGTALRRLGYVVSDEQLNTFWVGRCGELFGIEPAVASTAVLDVAKAYTLFLHIGVAAKRLQQALTSGATGPSYHKMYWNQTRMGGRDPGDVSRDVTLEDAFVAMGLSNSGDDPYTAPLLDEFEIEHSITLPVRLKELLSRRDISKAVLDCHPNNPSVVGVGWRLRRPGPSVDGSHALTIITPHQGEFVWAAAFNIGDHDARIYLAGDDDAEEEQPWTLAAPTVGFFFWDLAQTGLAWFQATRFQGGKKVRKTDIGIALVP